MVAASKLQYLIGTQNTPWTIQILPGTYGVGIIWHCEQSVTKPVLFDTVRKKYGNIKKISIQIKHGKTFPNLHWTPSSHCELVKNHDINNVSLKCTNLTAKYCLHNSTFAVQKAWLWWASNMSEVVFIFLGIAVYAEKTSKNWWKTDILDFGKYLAVIGCFLSSDWSD